MLHSFAVSKAIMFRKQMDDISHDEKVKRLKVDILNGPFHVFGSHDKCDRYMAMDIFCYKLHISTTIFI